jgi:protein-disulfide isomerase
LVLFFKKELLPALPSCFFEDHRMQPTRRFLLTATAVGVLASRAAFAADDEDPRMAPRAYGPEDAKNVVEEWFSFTCPHCAAFAKDDYPIIRSKLIDTNKIRYIFHEFPRDKLDLAAACVARSLPPSRYEPFVLALMDSQKQWAFNRRANPTDELAKMAALAGMPRDVFDKAIADQKLQDAIIAAQTAAEERYNIDSTPTFIINGVAHPGELSFAQMSALLTS